MRASLTPHVIAAAIILAGSAPARAISFTEALDAARRNDAQYTAAGHDLQSARLSLPIARAALLPSIGLSMSGSDVAGSRRFPNSLNQDMRLRVEYSAPQANLSLRVPIFNHEATSRVGQSRAQVEAAEFVYQVRGLELIDRLASAYLQVILSSEARRLAETQVQSLATQLDQVQQRLMRGEGTRVDVATTQANLDVAKVRLIEAGDQVELARRQLRRVTGLDAAPLRQVNVDYRPAPLETNSLRDWIDLAVQQSPTLHAREQALIAAKMGVQRSFAGHLPRLDLFASLSHTQNESISSLNQTSMLRSVGVQLNLPIYSGGGVDANVKQAVAEQARAEAEVRQERETIEVEVQRQYQAVSNGEARIAAHRQAVASADLMLLGARRSLDAGLGTANDVADAVARVFTGRRDLAQACIEYLVARMRLLITAGMTQAFIAADLDQALVAATTDVPRTTP